MQLRLTPAFVGALDQPEGLLEQLAGLGALPGLIAQDRQ
jgi:hypothetical protein